MKHPIMKKDLSTLFGLFLLPMALAMPAAENRFAQPVSRQRSVIDGQGPGTDEHAAAKTDRKAQEDKVEDDKAREQAIRQQLARFYQGWNEHDADRMVAIYADDIDHVNVFAQWHQGKQAVRQALAQFHAGPGKNSRKTYTVEKIRFLKPDVALVHVRSLSTVGNLGTYVFGRQSGKWLVVSFTNVEYKLNDNGSQPGHK